MWGPREGIEEAKEDLYKLGQFALKSARLGVRTSKEKFGKVNAAPSEVQAERIAKYRSMEAKRQYYKESPEDPTIFPMVVSSLELRNLTISNWLKIRVFLPGLLMM